MKRKIVSIALVAALLLSVVAISKANSIKAEVKDEVVFNASEQTQNANIVTDLVVEGFTFKATDSKKIAVDSNNKSIDGFDFTQRLKLSGKGTAEYRSVHFETAGASTVTIYALSGNSAEVRPLELYKADGTQVGTNDIDGAAIAKYTYSITEAGKYYLASSVNSVNIYYISATNVVVGGEGATEAPTTEEATTEAPTTEEATTEAPTTEEATTEAPTTEEATTEAPTTAKEKVNTSIDSDDLTNGNYKEDVVIGGVIFAAGADADQNVVIEDNNKSFESLSFTKRIKLGGTGTVDYRSVKFESAGNTTFTMYAMSSNNSQDRECGIYKADGTLVQAITVTGGTLQKYTATITEPGVYYFASVTGGVNVYGVEATNVMAEETGSGSGEETTTEATTEESTTGGNTEGGNGGAPTTGDKSMTALFAVLAIVAAGLLVVSAKKKENA